MRRPAGRAVAALTGLVCATAFPAPAAHAGPGPVAVAEGYVWAGQPTVDRYEPPREYAYNSSGGTVRVDRRAVGSYVVTFTGLGVAGGVAHVTSNGFDTTAFCVLSGWKAVGGDQVLRVRCYAPGGAPADARFVANFTHRTATTARFMSYLLADQPTATVAYTPAAAHRFDTHGLPPTVERLAVGRYRVFDDTYDAASPESNNAQLTATAVGPGAAHCRVADEATEGAPPLAYLILCTGPTGEPHDSRFTYTYVRGGAITGATPPAFATAFGTATSTTAGSNPAMAWYTSNGAVPSVAWMDVGRYRVRFPGMASWSGHAQAAALGRQPRYCVVENWGPVAGDLVVLLRCYDPTTSSPADTELVTASFTA